MEIALHDVGLHLNKKEILKNVNISIQQGKITSIVGKNGSGKSTLLKAIARMHQFYSGDIFIDHKNLKKYAQKELAQKISFLSQAQEPLNTFTVRELVSLGRFPYQDLRCKETLEDKQQILWALEMVDLGSIQDEQIQNLSGGQRQRAFIAMNLAQGSDYLFLDEPTTYLDIHYQIDLMHLIQKLNKEHNKTIVMVLHDLNQACRLSDYLFVMKNGEIYSQGNPSDVINEKMFKEAFGVKVQFYRNQVGDVIFHPEDINEKFYDVPVISPEPVSDNMEVEKRFLVSCLRENIFKEYEIDSEGNLKIQLADKSFILFNVKKYFTCERMCIFGDIYHSVGPDAKVKLNRDQLLSLIFPLLSNKLDHAFHAELKNSSYNNNLIRSYVKTLKFQENQYQNSVLYAQEEKRKDPHFSSCVFFEQSVVSGHPTHPNSKTRLGFSEDDLMMYSPETRNTFGLKLCAVKKEYLHEFSLTEKMPSEMYSAFNLPDHKFETYGFILVHPWQFENVIKKDYLSYLEDRTIIDCNTPVQGQALISLRSLAFRNQEELLKYHVKMSLSVLTTSDIRILNARAVESGVYLSKVISKIEDAIFHRSQPSFYVLKEAMGSYVHFPADKEVFPNRSSDRFSSLLRENVEYFISADEVVIPCAALIEQSPLSGHTILEDVVSLYLEGDRGLSVFDFFKAYIDVFLPYFLVYLTKFGISFEGHMQNTLIAFKNGVPVRTFIRDLSDIRVCVSRLKKQGIDFNFRYTNSLIMAPDPAKLQSNVFYSTIQGNIAEIIIALNRIYHLDEKEMWSYVKSKCISVFDELSQEEGLEHAVQSDRNMLLHSPKIKFKAVLKMRLAGEIENYMYEYVDNPLYFCECS